jgi:hypothetical protein
MAIDGIGKPPISGALGSVGGADSTGAASKTEFALESPPSTESAKRTGVVDGALLSQVQSGQITRDQYLDLRVDEAVKHLAGQLSPEKLDVIRATLREQLSTDPLLIAMARRAVGDR